MHFGSKIVQKLLNSQLWTSIFRYKTLNADKDKVKIIKNTFFLHIHPAEISKERAKIYFTWCLGGISFLLILIELITGLLLMFFYHPNLQECYNDLIFIEQIPILNFIRNVHYWAGHLLIITIILHMLRVFLTGSYRPPKEFNWVVGVILLTLVIVIAFTGYILKWDQNSYWATTVSTNILSHTPIIGHKGPLAEQVNMVDEENDIKALLLGSSKIDGNVVFRFYILHCVLLPLILFIFLGIHFWRVRKDENIKHPL